LIKSEGAGVSDNSFKSKLFEVSGDRKTQVPLSVQSEQLMNAFLEFGSETPDNINCYNHIEFGLTHDYRSRAVSGLKLKGKELLLSEVMNVVENLELPNKVRRELPDLTESEWDAITRMVTVILIALERRDH
jgi:hypothetical protein